MQLFVKICGEDGGCPEWTIVELQGDLETKSQAASLSGKPIGDLYYTHKNQPVLIIGHHILYGKVVTLEKPFAVLSKNPDSHVLQHHNNSMNTSGNDSVTMETHSQSDDVHYFVKAVIRRKLFFKTRPKPIIANIAKKV